ncbi:DUF6458 family protein [Microbacterium hominis]|uniref:DUF6458 domain-containing protein n=1 Tax=Microbacterium hominis TaxID=162426 RepID=A0A0B4C9S4_9MICO|nr:DUF6458 family protein [Microbacterium hominis]KIC57904.1 hypothetical protein RM52_07390 [Microbacterium hominis]
MGIGSGIALFVIGAILAFAINIDAGGVINLELVGYILMIAGIVVFVISLALVFRRRSVMSTARTSMDPVSGEWVTTRRTTDNGEPLA